MCVCAVCGQTNVSEYPLSPRVGLVFAIPEKKKKKKMMERTPPPSCLWKKKTAGVCLCVNVCVVDEQIRWSGGVSEAL